MQLPNRAGIGLKPEHFAPALTHVSQAEQPLWFEVHPENYMIGGGPRLNGLLAIREKAPLSLHGVGASLGGPDLPDPQHLAKLRRLIALTQPSAVSEHAVWSRNPQHYLADLLPLPCTQEALSCLVRGVNAFQEGIQHQIFLENPSNYLPQKTELDEADFLIEVARQTGCLLLLDMNNLYVSQVNCQLDPFGYIASIPAELVGEIHIAGHSADPELGEQFLIDSHDTPVAASVWELLDYALAQFGPKPVLLERDGNLPEFSVLLDESFQAQAAIDALALSNQRVRYGQ